MASVIVVAPVTSAPGSKVTVTSDFAWRLPNHEHIIYDMTMMRL